jgi:RHS repeat-associated protein
MKTAPPRTARKPIPRMKTPTGLLNEGFRYRDLETGTFITRDPAGFVDGPNLYTYVVQNPWTKFDPLGLDDEEASPPPKKEAVDDLGSNLAKHRAMWSELGAGPSEERVKASQELAGGLATTADIGVGMHPAGAANELFGGKTASGEKLSWWERGLAALGVIPVAKGADLGVDLGRSALKNLNRTEKLLDFVTDLKSIPASEANKPFIKQGWSAPYAEGTQVKQFTTGANADFVRVHGADNANGGAFMARASEIQGMSPEQIQQHLALKQVPTHIQPVSVPKGIKMQTGRVGAQPGFGVPNNGGVQYQVLERLPRDAFGESVPLQ